MKHLESWQSNSHATLFDCQIYCPSFRLKKIYNFNEFKLIDKFIPKDKKVRLLDIGCATGEVSRCFKYAYPNIDYIGCDISKVAIERAKIKYPKGKFFVTDSQLSQTRNIDPDYLFCRDVILHQQDPFDFLKLLCSIPKKGIILRLKTRDIGKTELDTEKSCQLNYGMWVPYIILNCDEIISHLASTRKVSKIVFVKNYMPLGGVNLRYLPKDCYLESTGTSETAMYIEFGAETEKPKVITECKKDMYPLLYIDHVLYKVIQTIHKLIPVARVWW